MRGLQDLVDWLTAHGRTHVAMNAMRVYWKPVWHLLEEGFELVLAAPHIRNMLGRKTDVNDAMWIADLLVHGRICSNFVPPAAIQELRDLARTASVFCARSPSAICASRKCAKKAVLPAAASRFTAAYFMSRDSVEHQGLESDHLDRVDASKTIRRLVKRLADLGYNTPKRPSSGVELPSRTSRSVVMLSRCR